MTRAVLFDFEHTLADVAPTLDAAKLFSDGASRCYAFLSAHDLPLPSFDVFRKQQRWIWRKIEWMRKLTGGEPDMRRVWRRMCRDFGLQRDQASLATLAWNWYEPRLEHVTLAADVIPMLETLAASDIELGLVVNTAWQGQIIDQHLEALGLLAFFPARAYSTEIGSRTPDPRLYETALEALKVHPAQTIYVGSHKTDLIGAQRLGMTAVMRATTDSEGGMPWADHTIRQIGELLKLPQFADLKPRLKPINTTIPALIV